MTSLVVTEQGARVSVRSERFVVLKGRACLRETPVADVDRVLLYGSVEMTAAFVRTALRFGCDVALFAGDGRYRGSLAGPLAKNVFVRVKQIQVLADPTARLSMATAIVAGKLRNQRAFLLRHRRRSGDDVVARAAAALRRVEEKLPAAASLDEARGFEGAGAAAYFEGFGASLRHPDLSFQGRSRRPPKDPVNACLSFGYAVLQAAITSIVHGAGLDPMVGALHDLAYGRPSLVLDLMEEWRPVIVDPVVARLVNRRQLGPADFGPPPGPDVSAAVLAGAEVADDPPEGVHLKATGRRIVVRELLARLAETVYAPRRGGVVSYRTAIEAQVHHLARVLGGEAPAYEPFTVR